MVSLWLSVVSLPTYEGCKGYEIYLSKDRVCDNSLTGTREKNFSISMRDNKKKENIIVDPRDQYCDV